jgi:formylglycine-generating enzyme required for sulfatase activity
VKVEYKLSGVTTPVDITVKAYNGDVELPSADLAAAMTGDRYGISEDGVGTIMIDPLRAFGTSKTAIANFRVELSLAESAADIDEKLYKIVDLEPDANGKYAVTDVTRKDFYNGKYGSYVTSYSDIDPEFSTSLQDVLIWTDVTNDVYKTDKLVLRRIPAAGKSFMFLTNNTAVNGGAGVEVSFKRDFYIGVFELTQAQVKRFTHRISYETNELYAATRAANRMYFSTGLRGTENQNWPEDLTHSMNGSGLIKDLQTKTGLLFDLPTEAMWEFACRAGTYTKLYTGDPERSAYWTDTHTKQIMRAYGVNVTQFPSTWTDVEKRNCDLGYGANTVGTFKPNAWGLYDMLGNLNEWCLDRWIESSLVAGITCGEDPVGPSLEQGSSSTDGVMRGGCYNENPYSCHSRVGKKRHYDTQTFGARLCIWLDNGDDGRVE